MARTRKPMDIFTITIRFKGSGEFLTRTEWGRTRDDAIKTLRSIFGDNFIVVR